MSISPSLRRRNLVVRTRTTTSPPKSSTTYATTTNRSSAEEDGETVELTVIPTPKIARGVSLSATPSNVETKDDEEDIFPVDLYNRRWRKVRRVVSSHPYTIVSFKNPFRVMWDMLLTVLIAYICVVTPLDITFGEPSGLFARTVDRTVDMVFVVDILVYFRTTFTDKKNGEEIWDARRIAGHYLNGWFWIDALAVLFSFPLIDLIAYASGSSLDESSNGGASAKILKLPRIVRFLRIFKMARIFKLTHRIQDWVDQMEDSHVYFFKLLRIGCITVFFLHINACGFCIVANEQGGETWLSAFDDPSWGQQYVIGFYFAATTVTTVGYGDISATNYAEMVYLSFVLIVSVLFYAVLIGKVTDFVGHVSIVHQRVETRMEEVNCFIRKNRFSRHLARALRNFFRNHFENRKLVETATIMQKLPAVLLDQCVHEVLTNGVMSNVPFFEILPHQYLPVVLDLMESVRLEAGERIYIANQEPRPEFYVLVSGRVAIYEPTYVADTVSETSKDSSSSSSTPLSHEERVRTHRARVADIHRRLVRWRRKKKSVNSSTSLPAISSTPSSSPGSDEMTEEETRRAIKILSNNPISDGEARIAFKAMDVDRSGTISVDEFNAWFVRTYIESDDASILGDPVAVLPPSAVFGCFAAFDVGDGKPSKYTYTALEQCEVMRISAVELVDAFEGNYAVLDLISRCFVSPALQYGSAVDVYHDRVRSAQASWTLKQSASNGGIPRRNPVVKKLRKSLKKSASPLTLLRRGGSHGGEIGRDDASASLLPSPLRAHETPEAKRVAENDTRRALEIVELTSPRHRARNLQRNGRARRSPPVGVRHAGG